MTETRIYELAELNLGYDREIRPVEFARAVEREVLAELEEFADKLIAQFSIKSKE